MVPPLCLLILGIFLYRPVLGDFGGQFGPHVVFATPRLFHDHHFFDSGPSFSHGYGGSEIGRNYFGEGKQGTNGGHFHNTHGFSGEQQNHGDFGHFGEGGALKNVKGESADFYGADGGKKEHQEGKNYYQGQYFGEGGQTGGEKSIKQGHRKGHTVKGFSTSHHKDETEKTEEIYDDAHDEGSRAALEGLSGEFQKTGASSAKGGHEDGIIKSGGSKKFVNYDQEYVNGKVRGSQEHFGGKKSAGHGATLGEHKVLGVDDVEAHQESSKVFKHHPGF